MNPLPDFGTEARPLRASALPTLLTCPLRAALFHIDVLTDTSGPAADTGSLVHAGVEHWHKHGDTDAAVAFMHHSRDRFPRGDIGEAELYFAPYVQDSRNQGAEVVHGELEVCVTIEEAEGDPFGPIFVKGRLDQIRFEEGRLRLWDLKTGSRLSGWDMLHEYAAQQAAYCLAACSVLNEPVYPGGIIRAYGYRVRGAALPSPPGVFFESPWGIADCHTILDAVRQRVREVRLGHASPTPGTHCSYCPADGLQGCLPLLRKVC